MSPGCQVCGKRGTLHGSRKFTRGKPSYWKPLEGRLCRACRRRESVARTYGEPAQPGRLARAWRWLLDLAARLGYARDSQP